MSNPNLKGSDKTTLLAFVQPISQGAGTVNTGWVPMSRYENLLAVLQCGVLGTSATVDAKLQQATDSGGTGAKDVTGKAITQLVKATDDNKTVMINCRSEELDVNNAFTHVRLAITVATAASIVGAAVYGIDPRYGVPSHDASVKQVVS